MKDEQQTYELRPRDTSELEWTVILDLNDNNEALAEIIPAVKPDYFTGQRCRLWEDVVEAFNGGSATSVLLAMLKPDNSDLLPTFQAKMAQRPGYVGANEILRHVKALREEAARRRCAFAAMRLIQLSSGNDDEAEVYARAAELINEIEDDTLKEEYTLAEIVNQIADDVQQRKADIESGRNPSVPTGIIDLDTGLEGGFKKGQLAVLAARPSVGKTSVALQLMKSAATCGWRTAFFSIEMTADEIGNRLMYSTNLVGPREIWTGQMDWDRFETASGLLTPLPVIVNDKARDITEIVSRMTILHRQGKCDVAFVDYLGLINPSDRRIPLYQQIGEVTGTLKAAAKRLGIPVILLAQLNREAAKDEVPQLYHLRDSGSIEQDADVVMMLQEVSGESLDVPDIRLYVRKNRNGRRNYYVLLRPNETRTEYREIGCGKD